MNTPTVRSIDVKLAKEQLAQAPQELQYYVKAMVGVSEGWERLFQDAMKKIREQAQEIKDLKEEFICGEHEGVIE